MKIENHVTSLELSKRLKELGVKQDSYFNWIRDLKSDFRVYHIIFPEFTKDKEKYSAFTASELGEMLPKKIVINKDSQEKTEYFIDISFKSSKWVIDYNHYEYDDVQSFCAEELNLPYNYDFIFFYDENEANCRAKLLIALIEQGYVKVEDMNK